MAEEVSLIEKLEKLKMAYRILILVGTIALLVAAFLFLVYFPKTEAIAKTGAEINLLEQKVNQARIKARSLAKFRAEQAQVELQFKEALRLLPNKREIPSLLRGITQLGNDSNLEFRFFSPKKEKVKDFYIEIPVSMVVSGNYHDVAVFFDKVGRMERIVNILNVSMKPVKKLSTVLVTKCDAVTYRFKRKADAKPRSKKKKK